MTASVVRIIRLDVGQLSPQEADLCQEQWTGDPAAPPENEVGDVTFAIDLLGLLETQSDIDKSRIFVVGLSNGRGMAHLLACSTTLTSRIAAFATASGAFCKAIVLHGQSLLERCERSHSIYPSYSSLARETQ